MPSLLPGAPVIIPDARRAEWDRATDAQRAARHQDWQLIHRWCLAARETTNRLAAHGIRHQADGTIPAEAQAILDRVPDMTP